MLLFLVMDDKTTVYSYKSSTTPSFEQEFQRALFSSSVTGQICKITGALSSLIAVLVAFYAMTEGYGAAAFTSLVGAALLFVAGAPLIAFGTITNEQRKQSALLALQVWETKRIDNPDIGPYRSRTTF